MMRRAPRRHTSLSCVCMYMREGWVRPVGTMQNLHSNQSIIVRASGKSPASCPRRPGARLLVLLFFFDRPFYEVSRYVQMEATSEMSWEFSSKHPPKSGQGESVRPRQTGKAPSKYTCSHSPEPDVEEIFERIPGMGG